jgi:hypothetical protein
MELTSARNWPLNTKSASSLLLGLLSLLNHLPQRLRRLGQRLLLLVVERQFQHLLHSLAPENHRLAQAHFRLLVINAHGPHIALVEQYRLANAHRHARDTKLSRPFTLDQRGSFLACLGGNSLAVQRFRRWIEIQWNAGDGGARPGDLQKKILLEIRLQQWYRYTPPHRNVGEKSRGKKTHNLALAMLAQHPSINRAGRHPDLSRQLSAQPRGIQKRSAADDLRRRQTGVGMREVGQDVDWVGDEQEDGGFFDWLHVADHAGEDGLVAADEVGAGFSYIDAKR